MSISTNSTTSTQLLESINNCSLCEGQSEAIYPFGKAIGLSYVQPVPPVSILFLAESPPHRGFFYEDGESQFRRRLFDLINLSGLGTVESISDFNQHKFYMADAINCRWNKNIRSKRNVKKIVSNCAEHLSAQIDLLKPERILAMGKTAQDALELTATTHKPRLTVHAPFILTAPVSTSALVDKFRLLVSN
ncbi:uracil-DNA glycosylase family protein [Pseudomonadota bacterium]